VTTTYMVIDLDFIYIYLEYTIWSSASNNQITTQGKRREE